MSLTSQGAGGTLSFPSPKSSREFKHKPICERIFCLSVIHFSVGLPSQMSGVLLFFNLACVSISLTDHLNILKGMCCWFFFSLHFSCGEKWQFMCHSSISRTHMGWGEGKWGTIAIFTDALGTHQHRDFTTTGCRPSDTLKRETCFLFLGDTHIDILIPLLTVFPCSLVLFGKGLHHTYSFLLSYQAPTSLCISSQYVFQEFF